jgi:hypothetical protein
MVASTAGVKARTPKPLNNDGLSNFEQPMAESTEVVWDFAKQGAAYSKDVYERAKAMADETNKVLEQSYSTVTKATPRGPGAKSDERCASASAGRRHECIPQSRMMRFLSLSTCGRGSDETPWSLMRIRSFAQLESLRRV